MSKPLNGVQPTEWAKHLRPWGKRAFWKRHRHVDLEDPQTPRTHDTDPYLDREERKKVKKRFGYEWRYKAGVKLQWYHTIGEKVPPNEWRKHWHWHATTKARDAAYKSLCRGYYNIASDGEYRPVER